VITRKVDFIGNHAERLDYIIYFKEICCLKKNNTLDIVAWPEAV